MYIFSEHNLAILDCADGMDRADENVSPASFILELFCHLLSDRRIHHVPMTKVKKFQIFYKNRYFQEFLDKDYPPDQLKHCELTSKALYNAAANLKSPDGGHFISGRLVTFLGRYTDIPSEEKLDRYETLNVELLNDKAVS